MVKAGILVVSDSSYRQERVSTTQHIISDLIASIASESTIKIVPDELDLIKQNLVQWIDDEKLDLIITTGGTGLSPRDNTPEATLQVIEKEIPGIAEYARVKTSMITPLACLSRSICGIRGQSLVINLPGSEKAVKEWLTVLLPLLPHALELIKGQAHRCGG